MKAGKQHLVIYMGADFSKVIKYGTIAKDSYNPAMTQAELEAAWSLVDNSGWTACTAKGYESIGDTTTTWSLSVGSGVTLGGATALITLAMTAVETAALTAGTGVWELLWTEADGTIRKRLAGTYEIVDVGGR